jgi:hypothetical protein
MAKSCNVRLWVMRDTYTQDFTVCVWGFTRSEIDWTLCCSQLSQASRRQSEVWSQSDCGDKEKDLPSGHQAPCWLSFPSSHIESLHYVKYQLSSFFYFTACIFTCNWDRFSVVCVLDGKLESCFLPYWEANEVQCKEQLHDPRNWNMVIRTKW